MVKSGSGSPTRNRQLSESSARDVETEGSPSGTLLRHPLWAFPSWIVVGGSLLQLDWSNLFGATRTDTTLFLIVSVVVFGLLAYTYRGSSASSSSVPLSPRMVAALTLYFAVAYVENGGVPVLQIAQGVPYDVYGFGIPDLHVLALSFSGYYGVRAFERFLSTRRGVDLVLFAWISCLLLSIANRSAVSFLVFACIFLYFRTCRLRPRTIVGFLLTALAFLYAFGQFGNARLDYQIYQATGQWENEAAIASISGATEAFANTGLSVAWLWSYMYVASPLANLNAAFDYADGGLCGRECKLGSVALYELVPDVLGVRLAEWLGVEPFEKSVYLIAPDLTASTVFGSAVGAAGILGGLVLLAVMSIFALVAMHLLRGSTVQETGLAILATILFFSFFENMISYSALSLQLVWAIARSGRDRHVTSTR